MTINLISNILNTKFKLLFFIFICYHFILKWILELQRLWFDHLWSFYVRIGPILLKSLLIWMARVANNVLTASMSYLLSTFYSKKKLYILTAFKMCILITIHSTYNRLNQRLKRRKFVTILIKKSWRKYELEMEFKLEVMKKRRTIVWLMALQADCGKHLDFMKSTVTG